jgi:hypothetical protein
LKELLEYAHGARNKLLIMAHAVPQTEMVICGNGIFQKEE